MSHRSFKLFFLAAAIAVPASAATPVDHTVEGPAAPIRFESSPVVQAVPPAPEPTVEAEDDTQSLGSGVASYYGAKFHGRRTASGERFDMHALTAAHRTLPFGSEVRVTDPRSGKAVTVRINDRGPFSRNRTIDLSRAAAQQIGLVNRGHGTVELELVS
nr:septal ring lytic transglycosylase RlpA family protein [Erythrobacter sp. QSSC1-22B]